jgi:hypothetical protein
MTEGNQICKNCSTRFDGRYCNQCGEKVYTEHDKSLFHFLEEGFHFITHFEGRFLTTLKTIASKPGKFSLDYSNGIRIKYFKPVSFFLLLVVLYLLFPRFHGLNMKLNTYVTDTYGFTWASVPLVKKKMEEKSVQYEAFAKLYDAKSSSVSKVCLFILIPLAALVAMLLFLTTRKFFFDHLIICTEISSIFIALHFLLIPFISFLAELINKNWVRFFWDDNFIFGYFILALDVLIVSLAFKRFYGQKWFWTIPKSAIYVFVFGEGVYYVYRLIVLVVTLMLV